jgi:hypothetical protein
VRGFCISGAAILTVSNTTSVVQYDGNSSTVNFPVGFRFFKDADLVVLRRTVDGFIIPLILNSDYTVAGAGSQIGGSITTSAPVATGETLTISRVMSLQQLTDLRNQGDYFAEIHEDVFDYLTMLIQQVLEDGSRALRYPRGGVNYDAQGRRIVNLANPVNAQDAATKSFVASSVATEAAQRADADANLQAQITGSVPVTASAFSEISWHGQTINNSVTIPAGKNAWSFGPTMTIASGQTVTVGSGSFYTIADGELH